MNMAYRPIKSRRRRRPARPKVSVTSRARQGENHTTPATTSANSSTSSVDPALPKPIDPETHRIRCQIINGPNRYSLFHEFPYIISADGYHSFRSIFCIRYEGIEGDYHACIKIIKYRSKEVFNIGGYINIRLPGERFPQIRRFTGQYSTKSLTGHLRLYTKAVKIKV